MSTDNLFVSQASSAPIFEKEKLAKGKRKKKLRVDLLGHFHGRDKTINQSERFFVTAMKVPSPINFRSWLNYKINYVKINFHQADDQGRRETVQIALNVNSLAKRLGLTPKEIQKLKKKGGLEDAIRSQTELIQSHIEIIDKYEVEGGQIVHKEEQTRLPLKSGLSAHSFLKMLKLAKEAIKDKPNLSHEIVVKQGWFKEHRFLVIPKEGHLDYHIFSSEVPTSEAQILGKGGQGTVSTIRTVAGETFAMKHAHHQKADAEAALEHEADNLTILGETPGTEQLYQAPPITNAKLFNVNILEIDKRGKVKTRKVNAMIGQLYKGDLFGLIHTKKPTDLQKHKICYRLGDILSQRKVAHGDIKAENFFLDKEGLPVLADMGAANIRTKKKGYVPPIAKGKAAFTCEMVMHAEISKIMNIKDAFSRLKELGLEPAPQVLEGVLDDIEKVDVFAMGSIMYETFVKKLPYYGGLNKFPLRVPVGQKAKSNKQLQQNLEINGCDKELAQLIVRMIDQDPNERISPKEFQKAWKKISRKK